MTKIDPIRMLRWRLAALPRPPWMLVVLLLGDLIELGASFALAAASPPPVPHVAYVALDVPSQPPATTLTVALLGIMLGLVMGVSLVGELWWMYRRMTFMRRRRSSPAIPRTSRV